MKCDLSLCFLSAKTLTVTRKDSGLGKNYFGTFHTGFEEGTSTSKPELTLRCCKFINFLQE